MRIITRPDFDGVVCASLLYEAEHIEHPVKWVEPNEVQKGLIDVLEGDIIANLPFDERCTLWFDHHHTNRIDKPFKGAFKIAPSAAGVIYEYYKDRFRRDYSELVKETDKIDSANLSLDEVDHPEKYSYVLLSMTVLGRDEYDEPYWNRLVKLLRKYDIGAVLNDPEVKKRCQAVVEKNKIFKDILQKNTKVIQHVSVTDFRSFDKTPTGNRFLVYSLFPESIVSVKIRYPGDDKEKVSVSVGHSIFNRNCQVNVGQMLAKFEGGGHRGAGSCTFHASKAEEYIGKIIDILLKNEPIDAPDV
ncbi:MAG: exopolyphosphatase [Desulfobacterales bacterium]|nr:MAG: exopolyphosphatase [Desulfobacterales bacterium]